MKEWMKASLNRQILTMLVGSMTLLGILIYLAENYIVSTADYYREEVGSAVELSLVSTELQSTFKTQVQEWKNVLIRGGNQKDREKYWGKFQDSENEIKELLATLEKGDKKELTKETVDKFKKSHDFMASKYREGYRIFNNSGFNAQRADAAVRGIDREPAKLLASINGILKADMEKSASEEHGALVKAEFITLGFLVAIIALFVFAMFRLINRVVINPLSELAGRVQDYGAGRDVDFSFNRKDELGSLASTLEDMQRQRKEAAKKEQEEAEKRRLEQEEQAKKDAIVAAENGRIKQALDVCQANVMMADADMNIVYLNDSVQDMLKNAEQELQTALPNFAVDNLMGFNVDGFHKNPSHQRNLLKDLREVYETSLEVAGRTFNLVAMT